MTAWVAAGAAAYMLLGAVLHRLCLLLAPPPESLFPVEGSVIRSNGEGFSQRILRIEGDQLWSELTLDPHAPGPPPHVHARFPEWFHVVAGCIELDLMNGTRRLAAGEEFLVAPGVAHSVRNPTAEPAVVSGPLEIAYALPRPFGLFLVQAYGFFDESPENSRPPRALLQMSFWSPLFDVWLPGRPIPAQKLLFVMVRPVALLLGYRPWYRRFRPPPLVPGREVGTRPTADRQSGSAGLRESAQSTRPRAGGSWPDGA